MTNFDRFALLGPWIIVGVFFWLTPEPAKYTANLGGWLLIYVIAVACICLRGK